MITVVRKVTARGVMIAGGATAGVAMLAHLLVKGDTADTATMIVFITGVALVMIGELAGGAEPKREERL